MQRPDDGDDTACDTDEGRAGLPRVTLWDDPTSWPRQYPHYYELSEFVALNCQNVGTQETNTPSLSDMYTLVSEHLPWGVNKSLKLTILKREDDPAYNVLQRTENLFKNPDGSIRGRRMLVDAKLAHDAISAAGMNATAELMRIAYGEVHFQNRANNIAALSNAGFISQSVKTDFALFAGTVFLQDMGNRNKNLPRELYICMEPDPAPLDHDFEKLNMADEASRPAFPSGFLDRASTKKKTTKKKSTNKNQNQSVNLQRDLIKLIEALETPHEKMTLWCLAARHMKVKYAIEPPPPPDFGRPIYDKAVRLHLEEVGIMPRSAPPPQRPLPFKLDGDGIDIHKIISDWAKDENVKDCKNISEARTLYDEADEFLRLLGDSRFSSSLRADARHLQKIYCDEFPELISLVFGDGTLESFPDNVKRAFHEMRMPDQIEYVETTKAKVQLHKASGGALDDRFMRQLNHDIRQGLTDEMYEGWALVFQLRDKELNMTLLKMVIQMSYMMFFLQAFEGDEVYAERARLTKDATHRLNDVCDTNIISPHDLTDVTLNPLFL